MTLTNDAASMVPGVVRVMTVDDHAIFRDGLAPLLAFYVTERLTVGRVPSTGCRTFAPNGEPWPMDNTGA